jgi:hypothetical protein
LGTQKAVVVQAALNANTNPSLALEWFVNGTKSNQTGRVFEYTPAAAGTFEIQAKSGSVQSNKINVNVGAAALVISELKVVDSNTIEIKAPGGATVAVTNNEVLPASYYDITKGIYVIELKTALTQGSSTTVTLTRDGLAPVSRLATFDTRKLEVGSLTGSTTVKDNKDGTYDVYRPHRLNDSGVANTALNIDTYTVAFDATNMKGSALPFKIETVSRPQGGAEVATQEGLLSIAADTKTASGSFTFTLNKDSVPGAYVYRYTINGIVRSLTVNVKDPLAEVDFVELKNGTAGVDLASPLNGAQRIYASEADLLSADTLKATTAGFNLVYKVGTATGLVGVKANADGSYDIVKDYLKDANAYKRFYFDLSGTNFDVPASLLSQSSINPNQAQLTVKAPDGTGLMRTQYVSQLALPTFTSGFRKVFNMDPVVQVIDAATPVGAYTYTLRILQSGVEIFKKDVVVNVKDYAVTSSVTATLNDAGESMLSTVSTKLAIPASGSGYMVDADIATIATDYANVKSLLVNRFVAQTKLDEIVNFDFATYTTAKNAFVTSFTTAVPFFGNVTASTAVQNTYDVGIVEWKKDMHDMLSPFAITTYAASGAIKTTDGLGTGFTGANATKVYFTNEASAITLINAYAAEVINLVDDSFDTLAEINDADKFAAAKTAYETAIAALYPTYQEFLNAGSATVKAGADGVYEIEKPMASGLDSKSITFNLTIKNYESAVNPAAALNNSYLDGSGVKKEFLSFTKAVSGPGLLQNAAFNTANTKIAIELNAAGPATDTEQTEEATPVSYTRYKAATHAVGYNTVSDSVTIPNIFALDAKFLTVNGLYTFTVNVGQISQVITVRVIDPKPVVDFTVDTTTGNGNQFTFNKDTGKWHATLGVNPTASSTDAPNAVLSLNIKNIAIPTSGTNAGKLPYSFTRKLPELTDTYTDLVTATFTNKNDGVANLGSITNLVIGSTGVEYLKDGEYVYTLTVAGVTTTLTLVVEKFPTLKITNVSTSAGSLVSFKDKYIIPSTVKAFDISFTGVNIDKATHYKLVAANVATVAPFTTGLTGLTATGITNGFSKFDLTKPISVQYVTDSGVNGLNANTTGFDNGHQWINVTLYRQTNITSFDPLNPTFDLVQIGYATVPVWFNATGVAIP